MMNCVPSEFKYVRLAMWPNKFGELCSPNPFWGFAVSHGSLGTEKSL